MNKELVRIQKRSTEILGDYPDRRAEICKRITAAEKEVARASAVRDAAEDLDSYDRATEVLKRAELDLRFTKAALAKIDGAPRMTEAEYMRALNTCKGIMDAAANNYRVKAAALMDQLKDLKEEYLQTASDTEETLVKLDEAANVLQSKYTHKETRYVNSPSTRTPDRNVWRQYALRYDNGKLCTMATQSDPKERADSHKIHDSVLCAAWHAIAKAYPRTSF